MAHAGHGYHMTTITHHDDGSATIKHNHESGDDKEYAVGDLDGVHDGIEDHLRERGIDPEAIEEAIDPGIHARALDALAKAQGVDEEKAEEKVSPGLHEKMSEMAGKE